MTADAVDEARERRTVLDGIAFLTGEDPSAGAFLLVVGMTTCVFVAAFQLAFPAPISYVLTALVLVVAVISFVIGAVLDILDYFDAPTDDAESAEAQRAEGETPAPQRADAETSDSQPVDAGQVDVEPVDTRRGDAQRGDAPMDED